MQTKTIFIVDDSEWHNILLGKMLQDCGYEVATFTDGYSLLENLQHKTPNLIISDINMPGINGFELCKKIRDWSEDLPVMFLSTLKEEDVCEKTEVSGAVGYIQKPFGKKSLLDVVAQKL